MDGQDLAETELQKRVDLKIFRVTLRLTPIGATDDGWLDKHPDGEYLEWDFNTLEEAEEFQIKLNWKMGIEK